jgi:anti-sigma factor RsiW
MNCHDARELFSARVDGALTGGEHRGLEAHLAGCPECRRELARFEATVALLHAAPPTRAPVGLVDRVLAAARPVPWTERLWRRLFAPLALGRPIAVTVVALVALTAVYLYERTPELRNAIPTSAPPAPVAQAPPPPEAAASRYGTGPTRADRVAPIGAVTEKEQAAELRDTPRRLAKTPAEGVAPSPAAPPPPNPEPASPAAGPAVTAAPMAGGSPSVAASAPSASSGPVPAAPPAAPAPPPVVAVPPVSAVPPAAQEAARAESKPRSLDAAREGERQAREAEARAKTATMARSPAVAGRLAAAPDMVGTLTVADRDAARRALAELATRLGSAEAFWRADGNAWSLDLVVPGTAYAELAEGLGRIGRWQPDSVPSPLPAQVHVTVRLAAP